MSKLLSLIHTVNTDEDGDAFVESMKRALFYLKLNSEAAERGEKPIIQEEIVDLYIENGWSQPLFHI